MAKLVIGCGYLGRRVAAKWTEAGESVFALTRSAERAGEFENRGWEPVVGDVTAVGIQTTLQNLPEWDGVLYAVGYDRASGLSQREVYVDGLENVLKALAGRVRKFLYISSTSVYGQNQGEWIDETSPTEPTRPNGKICREAERLIEQFFPPGEKALKASANILRLAGIYGPGRLLRRLNDLRSGTPIPGNPEGWLNLIHVDDAVRTLLACEDRGEPGEICLVSDDRPIRRREYYGQLAKLAGVELPAFDEGSESRYAKGLGKRCSNRKIRKKLRVEFQFPTIFEGLQHAVGPNEAD